MTKEKWPGKYGKAPVRLVFTHERKLEFVKRTVEENMTTDLGGPYISSFDKIRYFLI